MKVLVVEPGYAPYEKDIEGLHGMQEVVGGTITAIYPFAEPVAVVGNDDSISLGIRKTAAEIIDAAAVPTREHERKQKIYSH